LAAAYLKKARSSGWANWYLLADQAAQRSLNNLPVFNTAALLVLAEIAAAQHDFTEAIRLANEVLAYQHGNEGANALLITSYLAQGNLDKATELSNELTKQVPSSGSLSLQALVETAQGQDEAAKAHFQAAIELEDIGDAYGSAWLRTQYGKLESRHGNYTDAKALFAEALHIIPDFPLAALSYAELELKMGHYKQAQKRYENVLAHTENSSTIFDHAALQGLAQAQVLQTQDATSSWQKAEAILRKDVFSNAYGHKRELARLLLSRGSVQDNVEALSLLEDELSNRQDEQSLELYGWALYRNGHLDEANSALNQALETGFKDAGLLYHAATIEEALANNARAQSLYNQAKTLNPKFDAKAWQTLELRN
jgi:tetratricopeptide (TPR) repeat protein